MEGLSEQQVRPECFILTLRTYLLVTKVDSVAGGINLFMNISYSSLLFPFFLYSLATTSLMVYAKLMFITFGYSRTGLRAGMTLSSLHSIKSYLTDR